MSRRSSWSPWLVLAAVAVAFLPALQGEFNWDDDVYVESNPLFELPLFEATGRALSGVVLGNYHPATVLSLWLDHRLGGPAPTVFHLTSVLLHLINVLLVYRLVRRLSDDPAAAWVAALLFGIHPLRVESVAWISARKDVLYTSLYLGSLLCYMRHARAERFSWPYFTSIGLFVLSLLSKGMAVSLSLVLPLLDYLSGRSLSKRAVLEKLPFFALALGFGLLAIWAQQGAGATETDLVRPLFDRLQLASYAVLLYLGKHLWPLNLSAVYPYPEYAAGGLPLHYLIFPASLAALAALTVYTVKFTRTLLFGLTFFLVNIVLVLQLFPVGSAVAADRYTYLASIGLAYLGGEAYVRIRNRPAIGRAATALVLVVACLLGIGTWRRCGVWKNRLTLFGDVIARYPTYHPAYDIRGLERSRRGDKAGAIEDFDEAIRLRPEFAKAYNNRGNARADIGDREGAMRDFTRAIELQPGFALAHYNKGYVAGELGDLRLAIAEMSEAIRHDPGLVQAYLNRADAYRWVGKYEQAIDDYDTILGRTPGSGVVHHGRALACFHAGRFDQARADAERARELGYPLDPVLLDLLRSGR